MNRLESYLGVYSVNSEIYADYYELNSCKLSSGSLVYAPPGLFPRTKFKYFVRIVGCPLAEVVIAIAAVRNMFCLTRSLAGGRTAAISHIRVYRIGCSPRNVWHALVGSPR